MCHVHIQLNYETSDLNPMSQRAQTKYPNKILLVFILSNKQTKIQSERIRCAIIICLNTIKS